MFLAYLYKMKKIGLLSDTHSYIDQNILEHFEDCDEIWHAGDWGDVNVSDTLEKYKTLRGVYGNIDNSKIRLIHPKNQVFEIEGIKVYMTHIGGYPGKYSAEAKAIILKEKPNLFISGHSHILKVIPDNKLNLLHINPGAAGIHGFHQIRTMVRFSIDNGKISNLQVIELGKRV